MNLPEKIAIYFEPADINVEAQIVVLSSELFASRMGPCWWGDPAIRKEFAEKSIDRNWDWFTAPDLDGVPLACRRVAIVTGDGEVQGAMVISIEPVRSSLSEKQRCLFVDQICTAPRNRKALRKDGRMWFKGVGTELLKWGGRLSMELGCGGKLWLLASPEGKSTYNWLGFKELNLAPVLHDGIQYKPMELPLDAVSGLLNK